MPISEARSPISLDALLSDVAQLDTPALERFISQVLTVRARRLAPSFPQGEAALLERINAGVPTDVRQRYDALSAKRRAETLTSEEHRELLRLIDCVEQADAERARALADLARLRKTSVPALMATLGISSPDYA